MKYQYNQNQAMKIKKISFEALFALTLFSFTILKYYELLTGLIIIALAIIVLLVCHIIYTYPISQIMKSKSEYVYLDDNLLFHTHEQDYLFKNIDKIHIAPRYFKIKLDGKHYKFYRVYENDTALVNDIERWVKDKE